MTRIWIVECRFINDPEWYPCDFVNQKPYCFTNYLEAHMARREIQSWLQIHGSKRWYKKCFRVREYARLEG